MQSTPLSQVMIIIIIAMTDYLILHPPPPVIIVHLPHPRRMMNTYSSGIHHSTIIIPFLYHFTTLQFRHSTILQCQHSTTIPVQRPTVPLSTMLPSEHFTTLPPLYHSAVLPLEHSQNDWSLYSTHISYYGADSNRAGAEQ